MDDSNLWYYIVLGVIFVLSKIFGKKKEDKANVPTGEKSPITPISGKKSAAQSFEDIFKELTGESADKVSQLERKTPLPTASPSPVLAQELKANERIERPRAKDASHSAIVPVEAKAEQHIAFKRDEHFKLAEEPNEFKEGLDAILANHDGLRQAMVLKEVLDRKY